MQDLQLFPFDSELSVEYRASRYPLMRYMGSKNKLVPWIHETLDSLDFESALDAFSGSGVVSYLMKSMNKRVYSNDFLNFSAVISKGVIENNTDLISPQDLSFLLDMNVKSDDFIQKTFKNVFYSPADLLFLDKISANISQISSKYKRALAYTALFRSCLKKQPRGVFTISGNLDRYNDGRRDLRISLEDHFVEQVAIYNDVIFNNHKENVSFNLNVFEFSNIIYKPDLVYMDPPYVPASDDNCYVKRYHFLEGLSKYWRGEEIMENTKVKKIKKKYTAFSYRKTAIKAFEDMFDKFSDSTLVLSYSSNAYPDLETLISIMKNQKTDVEVKVKPHKYHFGNHSSVSRSDVNEYLVIGQG
ncbi:DNA adenine methylase [Algoriphagus sp. D3-2-R+10]|uniref:DNA adenine methylase n=1 Tax=Algoriphagus aurantiacus TaxID=3103948 RepID=UPI002B3BD6D9|nr:DNA adenine methylase [Algoriphagus sp. D3-2-R+10]MEB2776503.1 DNA adenine methylase [Algoriphagus sp. D3-2-R+10]